VDPNPENGGLGHVQFYASIKTVSYSYRGKIKIASCSLKFFAYNYVNLHFLYMWCAVVFCDLNILLFEKPGLSVHEECFSDMIKQAGNGSSERRLQFIYQPGIPSSPCNYQQGKHRSNRSKGREENKKETKEKGQKASDGKKEVEWHCIALLEESVDKMPWFFPVVFYLFISAKHP
jgi:hypothetical protein